MATRRVYSARMPGVFDRANQLYEAGQLAEARSLCEGLLRNAPTPDCRTLHLLGLIAYKLGEFAVTIDHLRRAIQICPNDPMLHNTLGLALMALSRYAEAVPAFGRLLALLPDFVDGMLNLASALMGAKGFKEAIVVLGRALTV